MERRLAAILAADVVGYSRLMGEDEAGTLDALKALRRELVSPEITRHRGRLVKLMGDGLLAEFASVVDAVACAVAIQGGIVERNDGVPDGRTIELRIGINLGDVMVEGRDIYGDGVNVAARLEGLADPGGICVSEMVYRTVKAKLDLGFVDLGENEVKNIAEPVHVYKITSKGYSAVALGPPAGGLPLPNKPSVAVLAFTNMSGNPEQEYFSDGITEDVITELSRFKNLFVIARNSSFTFKGQTVDVREVGQKLGVAYVVEGSVRRAGERVRITAQLIEASTGNHLWAERYDRAIEDIFEVQDDVVRAIATAIPGQIDTVTLLRAQRYPSANLTAYDCLLRGEWLRYQDWGSKEALALFEKAAKLDPDCARAYAHLANWHAYSVWLLGRRHEDAQRDTAFYGELAARCGPNDPQVHANLAEAYSLAGDSHQARHHIDRAIKLNPNDYVVMMYAGFVLAFLGDYGAASEWHDKMIRADPLGIEAWRESLMESYCLMGRYEEAIECTKGWRDIPFHCLVSLASCHAQLGRREEAFVLMNKHYQERPEGYDTGYVIRMAAEKIPIQTDRDRWLEGVRKAGFDI